MTQQDIIHLEWIYNRLIDTHGENENFDYMIKLKSLFANPCKHIEFIQPTSSKVEEMRKMDQILNGNYDDDHKASLNQLLEFRQRLVEDYRKNPIILKEGIEPLINQCNILISKLLGI